MPAVVLSHNGVPIRLTDERWAHIVEGHGELAGLRLDVLDAVAQPNRVIAGEMGELLAIQQWGPGHWVVVAYRELNEHDGFIITAFVTSKSSALARRVQVWP